MQLHVGSNRKAQGLSWELLFCSRSSPALMVPDLQSSHRWTTKIHSLPLKEMSQPTHNYKEGQFNSSTSFTI